MNHLQEYRRVTGRRVPAASAAARQAVEVFLAFFEDRVTASLADNQELAKTDQSAALVGQVAYLEHQVSTLKWLRHMNVTRRSNVRS